MNVILPTVITAGLFDSLNPCAISVALLFIALLFTLKKDRPFILKIGFFYIISVYLIYYLIGLGLLKAFSLFGTTHFITKIAAIVTIIFGLLNIKEYYFPHAPIKLRMTHDARFKISEWAYKASIPATVVMGILVGIFEFPCSGSVYFAIVSLLASKVTYLTGALYLLLYNIMFVLPLVLIFVFATNRVVTEKMINWQERQGRKMHLILAGLMISLGTIMLLLYF